MIAPHNISEIPDFLENFFKQKGKKVKVILFGSRARNSHTEFSDIDIAIMAEEDISEEILTLKELFENSLLPQKVDIINFNEASNSLKEEILKEGKVWIDLTK
ncbi:type VII toxin-antitoxin system MntA family adenylyltransferase antitoxin [Desulfurobacterium sp.]